MAYSTPTKTVGDVMRTVKRQFGDESGVQLEDADIAGWINDGQTYINNQNRVLKAKSSSSATAGVGAYTFPLLNIQQVESLHYDGRRVPNMSFAQAEETVTQADPTGTLEAEEPQLWYEWAGTFNLWPKPLSAGTIEIYFTVQPTAVTTTSADLLSLPDDYFMDVVSYVLAQAYEMDEEPELSQLKMQQLMDSLTRRGEEQRLAQNMTYETITVVDDWY